MLNRICRVRHFSLVIPLILFALTSRAETTTGELEIINSKGDLEAALLMDTQVFGDISGMVATISVAQTFKNTRDEWVNGRYVFPLPEGAAVDSLELLIGDRVIKGQVKEKAAARKTFEKAKQAGKKAGLLEQHRPNIFSISIANIPPHEKVVAKLSYVDLVRYENEEFSVRFPTTLTPRYIPGAPIKLGEDTQRELEKVLTSSIKTEIDASSGWASNTHQVEDATEITPRQQYVFEDTSTHYFSVNVSLDAGMPLQRVESSSHPVLVKPSEQNTVEIFLANGKAELNRDLVLRWTPKVGNTPTAAFFNHHGKDAEYAMLMLMPPKAPATLSIPRDVTFIVDSSGSMAGESMQQARQALQEGLSYLTGNDRFNIIEFNSSFTSLFKQGESVNNETRELARDFISNLQADGGTEMMGALSFALNQSSNAAFLRQIVFITDGSVGNERSLFAHIRKNLGNARLFTVGIGSSPNSYFMSKAADFGRGSYTYISDVSKVRQKMQGLFEKITSPMMRNIEIDWGKKVEQYPANIPDLYKGEPVMVVVKSDSFPSSVDLSGDMLSVPWRQKMMLSKQAETNVDHIGTIWARRKIASLMDRWTMGELSEAQIKPQIITLGIAHNIVSKFTSFVAVEEKISRPEGESASNQSVANRMPKGSAMPTPQTATPATLLSLLGLLMILLGFVSRCTWTRE